MISETMPLNEWPYNKLWQLYELLSLARFAADTNEERTEAYELMKLVKQAIKDAEEREAKLPFE